MERAELKRFMDGQDERTLEDAVRVIRGRRITFGGTSRASVCRTLLAEAARLQRRCLATPASKD
jgi:hypothetical protein